MPLTGYSLSISILIIGIMIAIGGIILGIGYAFNERRMKEFGRKELFECAVNGAIVGGIFLLFAPNGAITNLITQTTMVNGTSLNCDAFMANNTAICLAYDYLASPNPYTFMGYSHNSVLSTATTTMSEIMLLNGVLGLVAGIKIGLLGSSISFSYILSPIISELQYIVKMLGTVAISAVVQSSVLEFVAVGVMSVLLPTGIILRTFYPTRRLGGFLMAASISLYVVLPLSYVFDAMLVNQYSMALSPSGTSITQITASAQGLQNYVFGSAQTPASTGSNNSTGSSNVLSSISSALSSISNSISGLINWLLNQLAYLIVYAFVLPIFSLIITGISMREMARVLGAEAFFGRFNIM